jgi:rhodanese-related sulfurtransferase
VSDNATISRDELRQKIERRESFYLFEVLPEPYFRKHHLPGAIHMSPNEVAETAEHVVPRKDAEIVLYCWDEHCPTSPYAARVLAAQGYTNVREYMEGKKDWRAAGLPVERTSDPVPAAAP